MKDRVLNPNNQRFSSYGGRGIGVSKEWMDFIKFYNDMIPLYKEGLSLERIDVDKDYCKSNCTFITLGEQSKNRRDTVRVVIDGVEKNISDWATIYGIPRHTLYGRIKRGYTPEEAIKTPRRRNKYPKNLLFHKGRKKPWRVRFRVNGEWINIGPFEKQEEALKARDKYLHG